MSLETLNTAFDKHKEDFEGSFHTALWAVCADKITTGKLACFVHNFTSAGLQLGIAFANEKGYIPTPAYFKNKDHKQADEILESLNKIIFNVSDEEADHIALSSMF